MPHTEGSLLVGEGGNDLSSLGIPVPLALPAGGPPNTLATQMLDDENPCVGSSRAQNHDTYPPLICPAACDVGFQTTGSWSKQTSYGLAVNLKKKRSPNVDGGKHTISKICL